MDDDGFPDAGALRLLEVAPSRYRMRSVRGVAEDPQLISCFRYQLNDQICPSFGVEYGN